MPIPEAVPIALPKHFLALIQSEFRKCILLFFPLPLPFPEEVDYVGVTRAIDHSECPCATRNAAPLVADLGFSPAAFIILDRAIQITSAGSQPNACPQNPDPVADHLFTFQSEAKSVALNFPPPIKLFQHLARIEQASLLEMECPVSIHIFLYDPSNNPVPNFLRIELCKGLIGRETASN